MKKKKLLFQGIPVIQRDDVPPGTIYLLNTKYMHPPLTKSGNPDRRYRINKQYKI